MGLRQDAAIEIAKWNSYVAELDAVQQPLLDQITALTGDLGNERAARVAAEAAHTRALAELADVVAADTADDAAYEALVAQLRERIRVLESQAPPTPPTNTKPIMGVMGLSQSQFDEIDAQLGKVQMRRTYNDSLPSSFAASNAGNDVGKRASYWSWKPNIKTFATDTAAQTAFSKFLDTIPAGHRTLITAQHEPEDEVADGKFTVAELVAVTNKVGQIVRSKNRPELTSGPCFRGPWTWDSRSGYISQDYSGIDETVIDFIGIDPYRTTPGSEVSLQTILTVGNSGSSASRPSTLKVIQDTWDLPVVLGELGAYSTSTTPAPESSVAKFITEGYAWMKSYNASQPANRRIIASLWFHGSIRNPPSDCYLTGVEVPAYAATVADSKTA